MSVQARRGPAGELSQGTARKSGGFRGLIKRAVRSLLPRKSARGLSPPDKLLGLICPCRDEYFIKEFCEYYLAEGIDHIFIIDDDSDDKSIYDEFAVFGESVSITYQKDIKANREVNNLYQKIKRDFEWIIHVDADEFISTPRSTGRTIRQELLASFDTVDCVKIPWVMMACNGRQNAPKRILESIMHRWDHDKRHPHRHHKFRCRHDQIEVKCMFRTAAFQQIANPHCPGEPTIKSPVVVDSIRGDHQDLDPFHNALRERDINQAKLLCYHYRISSIENCENKLKTNAYYRKAGFSLEDLMTSDHADRVDVTLRNKALVARHARRVK